MSRVSAALSGLEDLDAILRVGLNNVLDIMQGAIGGILLLDESTQTLAYRVYKGFSSKYVADMRLHLGEGIAGRVARNGKSVLLEDMTTAPDVAHRDLVTTEGLKAFISVPLRAKDRVLGVINISSREPHHFTVHDMHLLHSIGDQLGVAIEQANLAERIKKDREEIAKLEEERERFLRFIGIAAHDLKAPLTAIQGFLWVMLGGFAGSLSDQQRNMLERSSVRISELLNLISDLLDIPRVEAGQIVRDMAEVSLPEIINKSCDDLRGVAEKKGIELKLELPEALPRIRGSAVRLQQVMTNLVDNAICYTAEGAVTVRVVDGDEEITVEITDNGIGIPGEDLPRIFDEFFRGGNVEAKGTGLGLSITRRIVEAHGGKIHAESPCPQTNGGSKFTFTLPKGSEIGPG
ncbi:sensor histidine kinase [Chloroflexota bacterium]